MISISARNRLRSLTCVVAALLGGLSVSAQQEDAWKEKTSAAGRAMVEGRSAESLRLYEEALQLAEEFGPEDPRLPRSLNNLANVYMVRGRRDEALRLYQRALRILEKQAGRESLDVAGTLESMAALHVLRAEVVSGFLPRYPQLTKDAVVRLGSDRPSQLDPMNTLTYAAVEADEAKSLLERALKIREKLQGKNHLGLIRSLEYLGKVYRIQNQPKRAETALRRALALMDKGGAREQAGRPGALDDLGQVCLALKKYADAEQAFRGAISARQERGGLTTVIVSRLRGRLAKALEGQGRLAEAESELLAAIRMVEEERGPNDTALIVVLWDYADLLRKLKREEEAAKVQARVDELHRLLPSVAPPR
jgi:tetratricopeptide (TPR) repeat protein